MSVRGVGKFALVIAILSLLAAGLTACGSDDSSSSTAAPTAATTTTAPADGGGAATEENGSAGEKGSASFRTKGGDNSIQDYGEEADGSELEAAEAALSAYLEARAEDDWAAQCDQLAEPTLKPLEQLAKGSPQLKGKDCPAILEALTAGAPASTRANPMTTGIASLRTEDDRAFALFHGAGGNDYFIPMVEEDGAWKVGALAASEFP